MGRANPESFLDYTPRTDSTEFLPKATPVQRLEACLISLRAFGDDKWPIIRDNDLYREKLNALGNVVEQILQVEELRDREDIAQRVILTSVALMDFTAIRGIIPQRTLGQSPYYRQYGMKPASNDYFGDNRTDIDLGLQFRAAQQYMSPAGIQSANERIAKNDTYTHVDTVAEAISRLTPNTNEVIHVQTPVTLDQLKELDAVFSQSSSHHHSDILSRVIVSFGVDDVTAGIYVMGNIPTPPSRSFRSSSSQQTKSIFAWENNDLLGLSDLQPRSELARPDVYISMLNKGEAVAHTMYFSQLNLTIPVTQSEEELVKALYGFFDINSDILVGEPPHMRRLWRRNALLVKSGDNKELITHWGERTRSHLQREFGNREAEVILTNSGVGANEAVIRGLVTLFGPTTPVYSVGGDRGWYYENRPALKNNFPLNTSLDEAQIVFINWDPMYPDIPLPGQQTYREEREQAIRSIYDRARQAEAAGSDQQFVLVIDKTTNLLLLPQENRPKNLTVMETASFTKHQEGGRNYFLGAIFGYGDSKIMASVQSEVRKTGLEPSPSAVTNFPRPTRKHIEKQLVDLQAKAAYFRDMLDSAQHNIPASLRIQFQPWTHYGFFVFPIAELGRLYLRYVGKNNFTDKQGLSVEQDFYDFQLDYMRTREIWELYLREQHAPQVQYADTFNLNFPTRLRIGKGRYPIQTLDDVFSYNDEILRLSYGTGHLDSTLEQMRELAEFMAQRHMARMQRPYDPYIDENTPPVTHYLINDATQ